MMPRLQVDTPLLQQLESALESSCATLVAVEALRDRASLLADDLRRLETETRTTIACLRRAVGQLRSAPEQEVEALAFGFVLGRDSLGGPDHQVRPLRTA